MNKRIVSAILIIVLCLLLLCSCSVNTSEDVKFSGDGDYLARKQFEQLLLIIKNKDKDRLKTIFSKTALNKSDNFENNADELFLFFQGDVESVEKLTGISEFNSYYHGQLTKSQRSLSYYVITDKQKYYFSINEYTVDRDNPDNDGIYLLLVVRAEDRLKVYDGDQKIIYDGNKKIPRFGIYLPLK